MTTPIQSVDLANRTPGPNTLTSTGPVSVTLEWRKLQGIGEYRFSGPEWSADLTLSPSCVAPDRTDTADWHWLLEFYPPNGERVAWSLDDDQPSLSTASAALAWASRIVVSEFFLSA